MTLFTAWEEFPGCGAGKGNPDRAQWTLGLRRWDRESGETKAAGDHEGEDAEERAKQRSAEGPLKYLAEDW